jgi:hypothetical protein
LGKQRVHGPARDVRTAGPGPAEANPAPVGASFRGFQRRRWSKSGAAAHFDGKYGAPPEPPGPAILLVLRSGRFTSGTPGPRCPPPGRRHGE